MSMDVLVLVLLIFGFVCFVLGALPRANAAYAHWVSAGLAFWVMSVIVSSLSL